MQALVLASNNTGKLRELQSLLGVPPFNYTLSTQASLGIPPVDEIHGTFIENALLKARHAGKHSGLPSLADDSGLCVPALNGAPGVRSARYSGENASDAENNHRLIETLGSLPYDKEYHPTGSSAKSSEKKESGWRAYYVAIIVVLRSSDDPMPLIAEGRWEGMIIPDPRGEAGFGYDPYFFLLEHACTAAQLDLPSKNRISHRAKAMQAILLRLQNHLS